MSMLKWRGVIIVRGKEGKRVGRHRRVLSLLVMVVVAASSIICYHHLQSSIVFIAASRSLHSFFAGRQAVPPPRLSCDVCRLIPPTQTTGDFGALPSFWAIAHLLWSWVSSQDAPAHVTLSTSSTSSSKPALLQDDGILFLSSPFIQDSTRRAPRSGATTSS